MSLDINKSNGPVPPTPPQDGGGNETGTNYLDQLLSKLKHGEVFSPSEFAQLISELPQVVSDLTANATNAEQTTSQADQDVISDSSYIKSMYLSSSIPTTMGKPEIRPDPKTVEMTDAAISSPEAASGKGSGVGKTDADVPNLNAPVKGGGPNLNTPVQGGGPNIAGTPTTAAIWLADNYATEETISMLGLMYYQAMAQLEEGQNTVQSLKETMQFAVDQGSEQVQAAQAQYSGQVVSGAMSFASAANSAVESGSLLRARTQAMNEINAENNALKNNPNYTKTEHDSAQAKVTETEEAIKGATANINAKGETSPDLKPLQDKLDTATAKLAHLKTDEVNLNTTKTAAEGQLQTARTALAAADGSDPAAMATAQGEVTAAQTALATATRNLTNKQTEKVATDTEVKTLNTQIAAAKLASVDASKQQLTTLNEQLTKQQTQVKKVSPGFDDVIVSKDSTNANKSSLEKELDDKTALYNKQQTPEAFDKLVSERVDFNTRIIASWAQGFKSLTDGISSNAQGLATLWQAQYQRLQTLTKAAQDNTQQSMNTSAGARDKFAQSISSEADWLMSFQQMRTQSFWK